MAYSSASFIKEEVMASIIGAVTLAHEFIRSRVKEGDVCIDATAGRGYDTEFLCSLVGKSGKVIAFDIQEEAVESTRRLISEKGYDGIAEVVLDSHANMDRYYDGEIDCAVFNLGWLPRGDHNIHTNADSSIEALSKALEMLKDGGILSLSIYYGRETGFDERDRVLEYLKTLNPSVYTVIVSEFTNRPNCPPICVFIVKLVEV